MTPVRLLCLLSNFSSVKTTFCLLIWMPCVITVQPMGRVHRLPLAALHMADVEDETLVWLFEPHEHMG